MAIHFSTFQIPFLNQTMCGPKTMVLWAFFFFYLTLYIFTPFIEMFLKIIDKPSVNDAENLQQHIQLKWLKNPK